jgi:hypothetical protein
MKEITHEASKDTRIRGSHFAWLMMTASVIVTGTMTYCLCYNGMSDNVLWRT